MILLTVIFLHRKLWCFHLWLLGFMSSLERPSSDYFKNSLMSSSSTFMISLFPFRFWYIWNLFCCYKFLKIWNTPKKATMIQKTIKTQGVIILALIVIKERAIKHSTLSNDLSPSSKCYPHWSTNDLNVEMNLESILTKCIQWTWAEKCWRSI